MDCGASAQVWRVREFVCVTGRVKCSQRAAGTPDPPTTPIYSLLSLCVALVWLSATGCHLV